MVVSRTARFIFTVLVSWLRAVLNVDARFRRQALLYLRDVSSAMPDTRSSAPADGKFQRLVELDLR